MKYNTIVIDPPWKLRIAKRKVRPNQQTFPYKTMSLKEIEEFPIDNFANNECHLFLWTTQKYLKSAFDIIEKWKFNFHIVITWDKMSGMCLFGFQRRTEFIIYAYRGKIKIFQKRKSFPTVIKEKSKGHSIKPEIFYKFVRDYFPKPRIDIFARKRHEGFDAWGDEVEKETQKSLIQVI